MEEPIRDGHDADLSALHVEHLWAGVARRRGLLRAHGQDQQDCGYGPHGSREMFLHGRLVVDESGGHRSTAAFDAGRDRGPQDRWLSRPYDL